MIPRRMLGFGFALFLMLVVLALIYSQYVMKRENAVNTDISPRSSTGEMQKKTTSVNNQEKALPKEITPDTTVDDIIDEALSDRDDLSSVEEDELKDSQESGASVNSLNTVYVESENQ